VKEFIVSVVAEMPHPDYPNMIIMTLGKGMIKVAWDKNLTFDENYKNNENMIKSIFAEIFFEERKNVGIKIGETKQITKE
jgi:hypothetical protein